MLLALETIMYDAAIFLLIKLSTLFNNGEIWGPVMCKAVTPSSPQHFPTPATLGDTRGVMHAGTACYNQTEKLKAAG